MAKIKQYLSSQSKDGCKKKIEKLKETLRPKLLKNHNNKVLSELF